MHQKFSGISKFVGKRWSEMMCPTFGASGQQKVKTSHVPMKRQQVTMQVCFLKTHWEIQRTHLVLSLISFILLSVLCQVIIWPPRFSFRNIFASFIRFSFTWTPGCIILCLSLELHLLDSSPNLQNTDSEVPRYYDLTSFITRTIAMHPAISVPNLKLLLELGYAF